MKVRTSVLRGFALLALSSLTFAACDESTTPPPPPPTVTVTPSAVSALQVGQTATLFAVVQGSANQSVTWRSQNPAVASVSAAGVVTGVAPGTTSIVAISQADTTARGAAAVTVVAAPVTPVTLTLVPESAPVQVGGTVQLVGIVGGPPNVSQTVNYTSSAPAIATVTPTGGLVTGVAPGTAVITARPAADPTVVRTATITVTAGPPPTPITISITPTTATTGVGDSVRFVATVQGTTNTAVNWTSNDQSIVRVNAQGFAVGVAPGTGVITATSAADPTVSVNATVVVTAATPPPPPPSISIASVTTPGGATINPLNVVGQINATVNISAVPANEVRSVAVELVDPQGNVVEVCRQDFTPALGTTQSVATINCPINTAAVDANGQAIFRNQNYTLRAVAFTAVGGRAGGGEQVALAQFCPQGQTAQCVITFNNVNVLGLQIVAVGPSAQDTLGRTWFKNFHVVVTPTIFTLNDFAASFSVTARNSFGGAITTRTRNPAPANMPDTLHFTGLAVEDSVFITASAITAGSLVLNAGTPAPVGVNQWIRIDNVAPRVLEVSLTSPTAVFPHLQYINDSRSFSLASLCPVIGGVLRTAGCEVQTVDRGVDRQYEAGNISFDIVTPSSAGLNSPVAGGSNVTNTAGVAETATNQDYALRITIRDALDNERVVFASSGAGLVQPVVGGGTVAAPILPASLAEARALGLTTTTSQATWNNTIVANLRTFGVDRTPPVLTITAGPAHGETNPAVMSWTLFAVDTAGAPAGPAGFDATPLFARLVHYSAAFPNGRCVHPTSGAQITTSITSSACFVALNSNPGTVIIPAVDGYYVMTAFARDAARNTTAEVSRTILRDVTAPTAGGLTVPSVITGGQAVSIFAQVTDNVDLGDVWHSTGYSGGDLWLVQSRDVIGTWGLPLVTNIGHTSTVAQFIRSVTQTDGANQAQGPGARQVATTAEFAVRDMAGMTLNDSCPSPASGDNAFTQNCHLRQQSIVAAVTIGVTTANPFRDWTVLLPPATSTWALNSTGSGVLPATMCNGQVDPAPAPTPQPCPSGDPTSALVTASVTGPFQTFNQPFTRVLFYYRVSGVSQRSHLIGQASVGVFDDTQTMLRTWTYTVNFSALGIAPATYEVFAVGVDARGDALMTQPRGVVINID
jgi:uncharacterized protein YjdB